MPVWLDWVYALLASLREEHNLGDRVVPGGREARKADVDATCNWEPCPVKSSLDQAQTQEQEQVSVVLSHGVCSEFVTQHYRGHC